MSNRLAGKTALAYRGTDAVNPPNWLVYTRAPTSKDTQNFVLGDLWLNKLTREAWILVSLAGSLDSKGVLVAVWYQISKNIIATLTGNNSSVHVGPDIHQNINFVGDGTTVTIAGNPSTNTLTLSLVGGAFAKEMTGNSGGAVSPTTAGTITLVGDGTTIVFTGNPATNTLTASIVNPVKLTLTANSGGAVYPDLSGNYDFVGDGTTIDIVGNPGTGTLTMSLIPSEIPATLTGDTGGAVHAGSGNNIGFVGSGGITTEGNPSENLILITQASSLATTYDADSGTAFPAGNILNIHGGTNINTSASDHTVTTNLDGTLSGITNLTVNNLTVNNSVTLGNLSQGVVQSNSSGVAFSSEGTNGQTLISSSTGAPVWNTLTAGANISIINGANSITVSQSGTGGNGWVFIGSFASYAGTFTTGITSAYTTLAIVMKMGITPGTEILPVSIPVYVQISDNGGSSYYSSNYTSGLTYRDIRSINAPVNVTATNGYVINAYADTTGLSCYCSCVAYLYNMTNTNPNKMMSSTGMLYTTSGNYVNTMVASGVYTGPLVGPVNALNISIFPNTPFHFYPGFISLYGLTY